MLPEDGLSGAAVALAFTLAMGQHGDDDELAKSAADEVVFWAKFFALWPLVRPDVLVVDDHHADVIELTQDGMKCLHLSLHTAAGMHNVVELTEPTSLGNAGLSDELSRWFGCLDQIGRIYVSRSDFEERQAGHRECKRIQDLIITARRRAKRQKVAKGLPRQVVDVGVESSDRYVGNLVDLHGRIRE